MTPVGGESAEKALDVFGSIDGGYRNRRWFAVGANLRAWFSDGDAGALTGAYRTTVDAFGAFACRAAQARMGSSVVLEVRFLDDRSAGYERMFTFRCGGGDDDIF